MFWPACKLYPVTLWEGEVSVVQSDMISYITGEAFSINTLDNYSQVVVLTAVGVGYSVIVPNKVLKLGELAVGEPVEFYTSFQVREASQVLYGFVADSEKKFFETLISVSGIGPKIALAMLSTFTMDEIVVMLEDGDFKGLSKVSGLGPKGAKKLILELQGNLTLDDSDIVSGSPILIELKIALESLGYRSGELDSMIEKASEEAKSGRTIEELVQFVLRN